MGETERRARLLLSCAMDGGDPAVVALVDRYGAEGAWDKIINGALGETTAERADRVSPDAVDRLAAASRARFVVPGRRRSGRTGWMIWATPGRSSGAVACPYGLWLRGPGHLAHLMRRSVAIVGSRAATAYGNGVASDLAADLVERGVTVVSGGAFGIDAAAHRGALAGGGPTVGVLACGVDVAYPPANAPLFDTLAHDHLLVSELPPGAHPTRVRFLARNRLIAAMAQATIVVEAALRSGARNTAGWALECGRPLMAVPGSIYSRTSTAPHLMIRNGQAVLVTNAAEVMELISEAGEATLPLSHGPQRVTDAADRVPAGGLRGDPGPAPDLGRRHRPGRRGQRAVLSGRPVQRSRSAGLVEGDERGWLATFGEPRR